MSNRSEQRGQLTSQVEVTNISKHGFWLFLAGRELFVPFVEFPWFAEASVARITNVEWPSPDHLYWPELDIDLSVRSIEHPTSFRSNRRRPTESLHRTRRARCDAPGAILCPRR